MWIIFGNKLETERVRGGAVVERHCQHCGETAWFYERVAATKLSLYFVQLIEYGKRRVMACGACNTLYATDELGAPDPGTAEKMLSTAERLGAEIGTAAKDAFGKLAEAAQGSGAKDAFGKLTDAAKGSFEHLRAAARDEERPLPREASPSDDPLADDEATLERKFRELEKRYRVE